MKIMLVDGAHEYGGQARHVFDLAMGLRDRGQEVTVACGNDSLRSLLRRNDIPVSPHGFRTGPDPQALIGLSWEIRQVGYDVVHTHGVRAGFTGRLAARIGGCPKLVHTVHTMSDDLVRVKAMSGRTARYAYRTADRWLGRVTDVIITVSEALRRRTVAQGIPSSKVTTVHSGVDLSKYQQLASKHDARHRLQIPSGCTVIGTTARLTRQKNLQCFIQAAKTVAKDRDDALFVIVGEGEEMGYAATPSPRSSESATA
jgi:glycosyltransferase involved in cell wall biosynthesis